MNEEDNDSFIRFPLDNTLSNNYIQENNNTLNESSNVTEESCSITDNSGCFSVSTSLDESQNYNSVTYDNSNLDVEDCYKTIQAFFSETERISKGLPIKKLDLPSSNLVSILRPYQYETVQWMIMRECEQEKIQLNGWDIVLPAGGILADEMGLGKTVEMLACIVGHTKVKDTLTNTLEDINLLTEKNIVQQNREKRKISDDFTDALFLKKKPKLSSIRQNILLKNEIRNLLEGYFIKFKQKVLNKRVDRSNTKCNTTIEDCFKIVLLNRLYNYVSHKYTKEQVWAYLISEFSVDQQDSIGYTILQKEIEKQNTNNNITNQFDNNEAVNIILSVDKCLITKWIKKFDKDVTMRLSICLQVPFDQGIPLLENENVQCKCGSHKANGSKIQCLKCGKLQHMICVGLDYSANKRNINPYYCPNCWMNEPPIQSSATLIVIPSTLAKQWEDEIKKHASDHNLSICYYGGVRRNYILPPLLAEYDIVLVTFDRLSAEFSFLTNETRSLRYAKRYHKFITPLTCINWWRLCIDEAQMVEGINKVNEMAMVIKCVHLWAITGTPIGKSLNDLYGLTTYLRIEPFTKSLSYWKELLRGDQSLLHTLFAYIMRRQTKEKVYEQLKLPSLKVETIYLSFPPVEGFFYNSTHNLLQRTFMQNINNIKNLNQPLKKANRRTVESILKPLLSLRQACVHPRAVKSMELFNLKKNETMEQLLEEMIKKTKICCEDILRMYVMLINGAAGIHIANKNYKDAVLLYRSILAKTIIYNNLNLDSFQMIHVMHNLYEAAVKDTCIELTDEEKEFPKRIEELETKCLEKKHEMVEITKQQFERHFKEIKHYLEKYELGYFVWWQDMLKQIKFTDVQSRVLTDLKTNNIDLTPKLRLKLSSVNRLTDALNYWLTNIESKRNITLLHLDQITNITSVENLWIAAENCHIRKDDPKKSCVICRMENVMSKYEALIFNIGDENNGHVVEANWKMPALECVLNVLLTCSRMYGLSDTDNKSAANQLKVLNLLRREFRTIRAIWSRQCDVLHVYDETRMAKCSFSLTEQENTIVTVDLLNRYQLDTYHEQSSTVYSNFQSKYGSLQYLKNLENRYKNGGNVDESCPVCQNSMDEKRAVMICGHFTCYGCMQSLMEHSNSIKIQCPVCRTFALLSQITCVHGGGTTNYNISEVKGNYSIKILAITAKILHLRQQQPNVKILIFSTWKPVLDVIQRAFKENQILFQRFISGDRLESFKKNDKINALLIPLHAGSKGLNLTEASHIIFTEPVLNLADEKQAIGRIYRLGQSKEMTVHKFVIKGTVEEHINRMNKENDSGTVELTFKCLRDLFETCSNSN